MTLDGIEILEAARVLDNERALGRVITEAEFIARLPAGVTAATGLGRRAGDEALLIRRESDKGIARTVDVRKTLRSLAAFEDADARRRLGWTDGAMISFSVSTSNEGSARPSEVVAALYGAEVAAETDLARLGLWGEGGTGESGRTDPLHQPALPGRVAASHAVVVPAAP